MSDRFRPISMEQLTDWVFTELDTKDSLFGIPRSSFFVPRPDQRYRVRERGTELETPFGVAAGPHTQMAQNILAAWVAGARVIELKTVQTLDQLEVNKPCIDVTDEGYNVEWSQELRVFESFDEYLRAWVLVHALHHRLGWPGGRPGIAFDMSVGYNLEGILRPNVQWYLDAMADASAYLPAYIDIVARRYPAIREIDIPARLSDSVTLSTMHGCPPDEIERITAYLLTEKGLHTAVKCNPTLLGAEGVRSIVNGDLGFTDVPIPDTAFGHDLRWDDAVPMFGRLRGLAAERGLGFGLKLSNTLEVENWRSVFAQDPTMYLSGRPLHAVTVNLASRLAEAFEGSLPVSFAGGADAFNVAELLRSGMRTVTVASDLLKHGGYLRLLQYPEQADAAFDAVGATSTSDFIVRSALAAGFDGSTDGPAGVAASARFNLRRYADAVRHDWRYRKASFRTDRSKTARTLGAFDCIAAPCVDTCPVDQAVPLYMDAVRRGAFDEAVAITRADNPLPSILGRVCDHVCEATCIRTHLDQPLAIRQVKRFIMDHEAASGPAAVSPAPARVPGPAAGARVAIIGAGPAGLAAARELVRDGFRVTIFEAQPYPGGMPGGAIPAYRLPDAQIEQDVAPLVALGVEIRYGQAAGVDVTLDGLRADGFAAIFVAVGAQLAKRLGLPGEDASGIVDGITFLRSVREGHPMAVGRRVGVVGAGDTAMDCVRSALRVGGEEVSLIYRRTIDAMPADREEVHEILAEGVRIVELASPTALHVEDGQLAGLVCARNEYRGERDASGRKVPTEVPGSAFEIGLDTLILAVSQHAVLDFFGERTPELTRSGYLAVDPLTLETSVAGVYAGGDAAAHGPSSIVQAAADGKRAAAAIAAAHGVSRPLAAAAAEPVDVGAMLVRKARREYRVPVRQLPIVDRAGFEETTLGYTADEAMREASRCLDCHTICSLCVGVCPNLALMTYQAEPFAASLPALTVRDGSIVAGGSRRFAVDQRPQIAVLTDLCNECGNCVTACPTSGSPYRDKPRLYLDRADFEAQPSNAFMLLGAGVIEGRFDGATHRVEVGDAVRYTSPAFAATLAPDTLALVAATAAGAAEGDDLSLEPAATMLTLLRGVTGSMPEVPLAVGGGTFIGHPGYAD
jgi:putative selenate reductase